MGQFNIILLKKKQIKPFNLILAIGQKKEKENKFRELITLTETWNNQINRN